MYLGKFVKDGHSLVHNNSLYNTQEFHIEHDGFESNPEYDHSMVTVTLQDLTSGKRQTTGGIL